MRNTSRRTPNAKILRVKLAPTRPPGGSLPHPPPRRRAAALYAARLILAGFASYLLWAFAPVMEKSIANAIKKHQRMERLIL